MKFKATTQTKSSKPVKTTGGLTTWQGMPWEAETKPYRSLDRQDFDFDLNSQDCWKRLLNTTVLEHSNFNCESNLISSHVHTYRDGQQKETWANINGLVTAAQIAFDHHYPLTLSPDDIWITLTQGLSLHINQDTEKYRRYFVNFDDKKEIIVYCDDFVKGRPNNWDVMVDKFSKEISKEIGLENHTTIVQSFSTTGLVERICQEVVLMDAMKNYFEYTCRTCCGIPYVRLLGTREDWQKIRDGVERFRKFDCDFWLQHLIPVLDKILASWDGEEDMVFWESFYKENGGSGGPYVNGWINVLFPYLASRSKSYLNSYLDPEKRKGWRSGPNPDTFPLGLSKVPFKWEYYSQTLNMELIAGFVGATQDEESLEVRPVLGWGVLEKSNG